MRFTYKAMDGAGFAKDGILEASSEDDALRILFERGYRPLDLKAEAAPSATRALISAGSGAQFHFHGLLRLHIHGHARQAQSMAIGGAVHHGPYKHDPDPASGPVPQTQRHAQRHG